MLFCKILFLALYMLPIGAQWQRVNTPNHISFLFPNNAQEIKKEINGIPSHIYQTKDLTCVFGVVCSDISSKKAKLLDQEAQMMYEEMKKASLSLETVRLKNEKTIPYDNMLIKEIEYTVIKNEYEMTYFKRFIFRETYIYQISIGSRTRHRSVMEEEKEIFFNSISFSQEKKNKE